MQSLMCFAGIKVVRNTEINVFYDDATRWPVDRSYNLSNISIVIIISLSLIKHVGNGLPKKKFLTLYDFSLASSHPLALGKKIFRTLHFPLLRHPSS